MIKIVKQQAPGTHGLFGQALDEWLIKSQQPHFPAKTIRPSQITECMRYLVGDILGICPFDPFKPRQRRVMDNGNSVHTRYLDDYLPKMGCLAKVYDEKSGKFKEFKELSLRNSDYWIKARLDAVIIHPFYHIPYIFELKSMEKDQFTWLNKPDAAYIAQVHLYMFLTGIRNALVFYECKNDQELKEFEIVQDDALLNSLLARIRMIQKFVEEYPTTKFLPECERSFQKSCKCKDIK